MTEPVYMDYAATSAVRPEEVVDAVAEYLRGVGATPGRGGHARALEAGRLTFRCRQALAALFSVAGDPGRIVFQANATHALNTALLGILRPGDVVVRTQYDHNAVRRPVAALAERGVEERILSGRPDGGIDMDDFDRLLSAGGRSARLVVLPHASNVLGTILPVSEISGRARAVGALVLLDAAQSAGHLPVDVDDLGIDLLAFTGHKGLLGPQGTGGLWVREGVDVEPLLRGGAGGDSLPLEMPAAYPDRLEAGTLNAPGIAGLLAGVEWLLREGMETVRTRERGLKQALHRGLRSVPGIEIRSPPAPEGVGIVTVTSERVPADRLAHLLEREHGILVRAGLHCAPEAHEVIGTLEGGAVRFSIGWATTEEDVRRAIEALRRLTN